MERVAGPSGCVPCPGQYPRQAIVFHVFYESLGHSLILGACRPAAPSDRVFVMADMTDRSAFEQLLRPLRRGLNAELAALLLRMQADDEVQARYEDLAERNTEGQLSPAEQNELVSIVRANSLLTVLKAEARAFLQHPNAA
jgi:hypothetical protein